MRAVFAIILACAGWPLLGLGAAAQSFCSEGRTASGTCVNPRLGQVMREANIIATQPKISGAAPLNLPSEDAFYALPADRHEQRQFFGAPVRRGTVSP